ncbi:unnamed protein product, partial [Hymenolepis diminuta]
CKEEALATTPARRFIACLSIQAFLLFFASRRLGGWLLLGGLHWFSLWSSL